jgi:alpha-1,2-mannosyltransferase
LVNLTYGQNGFLTASLLGGALAMLRRWPLLAGILFDLLSYKPQFGLMIPRRPDCRCALARLRSGSRDRYPAHRGDPNRLRPRHVAGVLRLQHFTRVVLLETGAAGWHEIVSIFARVRMWGGTISLAYALPGAITVAVASVVIHKWRSHAPYAIKAAMLTRLSFRPRTN